jgi:branched-chain amino acid transport system substrate-binding protein
MKKLMIGAVLSASVMCTQALADIKVGIILGFTGPIESLTPAMAAGAELAFKEASDSGALLGGAKITAVRADSTCVDSAAATAAAERLVTSDKVVAIMGADCSGVTTAVANNVAIPNGVVMISPSATSPALTTIDDKGLFFRTAPSDARQGEVLAQMTQEKGINSVAITYTNNDYGKGLADSYSAAAKELGIKVEMVAAHEDGKADYSAEVGALDASGADVLVVLGYLDQGGKGIIEGSLDSGAFDTFILSDGMIGQSLVDVFGADLNGSFGSSPGLLENAPETQKFASFASSNGIVKPTAPFVAQSYDAAALIVLAMQAGGKADRETIKNNVMNVANAPGVKIYAGELEKALDHLAKGEEIDYEGATRVEFTDVGEDKGNYKMMTVKDGKFEATEQY